MAWIKGIVAECKDILLSSDCGRYHALVYNDSKDSVTVLVYMGHNGMGTGTLTLPSLSANEIDVIYKDLLVDFG